MHILSSGICAGAPGAAPDHPQPPILAARAPGLFTVRRDGQHQERRSSRAVFEPAKHHRAPHRVLVDHEDTASPSLQSGDSSISRNKERTGPITLPVHQMSSGLCGAIQLLRQSDEGVHATEASLPAGAGAAQQRAQIPFYGLVHRHRVSPGPHSRPERTPCALF